jgi:hypothetical protein
MPSPKQETLAVYLVKKVGLRKATSVCSFVVAWGIYSESVDGSPTLDGYTAFWNQSLATTYRERDMFRICFPQDKVPDRVWSKVRAVYEARVDRSERETAAAQVLSLRGSWS